MADIQSDIKVNIDTSSALASIKNLQRQISTFQSAMAKGSAANSAAAQNLQKDLLQNINATGRFAASMTNVRTTTDSFTNSLEKNKFSMGEYFRFAGGATKTFGKFFKSEFETINKVTRERVKDLQTQYIQLGRDANGAMRAMKVRPLTLDLEDLGTKTQMAAQRQQLFNQLIKQGSTNLLNWGKNTQWAGRQLMVGFTIPLAVFGSMASKTFMDLEKQAIRFKRVYGDAFSLPADADKAVKEMQELASEFTKYGVAIEKTMELAADAAQMGLTGSALNAQVREATRLAVLGEVDQQEALSATISVTNAFGVAAEDLAKKIDFLNAVENETVTSINDLTIAIPKAGPVVKQLGGDVEDLAFFLTAMKEGGINASEGANALKSGLASLINPTKVSAEFLQKLGVNINGIVEANKGDVKGIVIDFAQALDTLDPLNRARAIEQLFGKFQFSRISTLFQNVIAEGNQAQRVLELANASTAELATLSERELGKVAESTTFKYEKAIQDFRMALAPVGEEFLKAITPIIEFGTSLIKQFNNMDSGVKSFVTNITLLFAGLGPVLLMTVGLLANGIANIIKGAGAISQLFQRLKGGPSGVGGEISYMTQEQMEALAVAASLDQVHSKLQQTFTSERAAIDALTLSYQRAVTAQRAFGVPPTMTGPGRVAPAAFAAGTLSVPGPKGAGDVVPAMLSPGEAVIPADQAEKYRGFISSMIAGKVPGFANGVMLGMPRSAKSVSKNRDAADAIYQEFLKSSYANVPPTEYGHQIAPTSGHSFPIFGLGGVYSKAGGGQVFVKPVMDETAALAEIRGTQIARQAHGLEAPEQRIVVIRDPLDPTRERRFLALESDLDAKFIQNQPKAVFNEEQYFRQLVASLVRVDKDLAAANVFGNVVADVGPAGVFDRASGVRTLKTDLPSMEEQALVNLLGIKGGAKRAFAESTLALMASMTPQQYHQYMLAEIQRVLPALKQTVAGFGLSNPSEIDAYDAMIKRLEIGLGVDWSKFHAVHSAVKIAVPKAPKAAPVAGYANGVVSVPGPKGKGDVVPAMLSPGEAVIPTEMAKKYAPLISGMIAGNIPGYSNGTQSKRDRARLIFGQSGTIPAQASHSGDTTGLELGETLKKTKRTAERFGLNLESSSIKVFELGETLEDGSRALRQTKQNLYDLDLNDKAAFTGGYVFPGTAFMEPRDRNRAYEVRAEDGQRVADGAPATLEDQVVAGERAASALRTQSKQSLEYAAQLQVLVEEGRHAQGLLKGSNAQEEKLKFMREHTLRIMTDSLQGVEGYQDAEVARAKAVQLLASAEKQLADQVSLGRNDLEQLEIAEALYVDARLALAKEIAIGPAKDSGTIRGIATSRGPSSSKNAPDIQLTRVPQPGEAGFIGPLTQGMESSPIPRQYTFGGRSTNEIALQNAAVFQDMGYEIATAAVMSLESGFRRFLRMNSPSKELIEVGANSGQSLVRGAEEQIDDAGAAGQKIARTAVQEMEKAGIDGVYKVPGSRRATTNPAFAPMPTGTQTGRPRVARKATAPQQAVGLPDQTGLMNADGMMLQVGSSAGMASKEIDKLGETAKKGGVGLLGYGGIVSNLTFGATALAGAMSTVGGDVGAFGQEIFKVSGFIFAATSIIQAFTQMKVLELAATKMSVAKQAMAFATYGTGVAAGKGFAGMLARAAIGIGAFLGPIGIATLALGLFVGGIYLVNKAREEEQARIEGLGKVANLAADKIKKLADIFGIAPIASPLDTATLVSGVSATERVEANEVRASEGFAEEYAAELEAIRTGAQRDVELALQFLSVKLSGMGFEPGMIDTIVNALLLEAGRTDLDVNFKAINIGAEGGVKESVAAIQQAAREVSSGAAEGVRGRGSVLFDKKSGERIPEGPGQMRALQAGTAEQRVAPIFTEGYLTKINTLSEGLSGTVSGLSSAFAGSKINIEEFSAGMNGVSSAIAGIQDESARSSAFSLFLEGIKTEDNAEFIDSLKEIEPTAKGIADAMIIIKQMAGGLEVSDDLVSAFAADSQGTATAAQIRLANKAREESNKLLDQNIEKQKDSNDAVTAGREANAAVDAAVATLGEQNVELDNSITAYDFLIEKGYSAADAFTLASSAGYAAAIAASAADPEQWGKINEELDEFLKKTGQWKKISSSGSAGGAPQRGPFEDVLASLKNISQRSVNVKGGIDEIFKLFGKNRNVKLNSGFESLFVKADFSTSFSKFLTSVDAKTRNLLVSFKNGTAVLSKFGKAAQKAFEANALSAFRLEVKTSIQEIESKTSAIKILTQNNFSYAEAVDIATNAERASLITSLDNNKNKKSLKKVLKDLRLELELVGALEKEQEAQQANDAKIQETKDMLEGVRQQIREYNNFAKAQEKLSKSNLTLIEQQAILRDPVLITMYLDSIDPDLLKAKLKQAINPEFIQTVFDEGFNNAMDVFSSKEAELELQLKIKTQADSSIIQLAQREIEDTNFLIDDLEADLKRLEVQEQAITDTYDERIKALDEVKSINEDLVRQQNQQLTVADALSRGDISAAAKAAQDLRASQAARSIDMQRDGLEKAREQDLASLRSASGKTRKQLETEIKDLQMKIFEIEEARLEPAQRRVDLATREKDDLLAAFTVLGNTQLQWEGISSKITLAKVESDLYKDSIQQSLDLVNDLGEAWKNATPTQKEISFAEPAGLIAPAETAAEKEQTKTATQQKAAASKKVAAPVISAGNRAAEEKKKREQENKKREEEAKTQVTNAQKIRLAAVAKSNLKNAQADFEAQLRILKNVKNAAPSLSSNPALRRNFENAKAEHDKKLKAAQINVDRALSKVETAEQVIRAGGYAAGGMVKVPKAEPAPVQLARGGMVAPAYLRAGGMLPYKSEGGSIFKPLGTDTVPAMLTPGEFVMSRYAVDNFGVDKMKAINSGTYSNDSVYNYSINVNVQTGANANDIARNVMTEIRRIDSQRIRGNKF